MADQTRFEAFKATANSNMEQYRKDLKGDGSFQYVEQVMSLAEFSNKLNQKLLVYLFGEQLGEHLAVKFVVQCNRDLLKFLASLSGEHRLYLLHEIKNNELLYAHS